MKIYKSECGIAERGKLSKRAIIQATSNMHGCLAKPLVSVEASGGEKKKPQQNVFDMNVRCRSAVSPVI